MSKSIKMTIEPREFWVVRVTGSEPLSNLRDEVFNELDQAVADYVREMETCNMGYHIELIHVREVRDG